MKPDFRMLANACIREITPYQPGKSIDELVREMGVESAIKLASNENPLGPSSLALNHMQQALTKSHIYPDGGCYELRQSLSNFFALPPDCFTIGNGSENILELIIKAYLKPGDHAVISEYAFLTIKLLLLASGIEINYAPATAWGHDVDNILAAIDSKTRVIFIVNPNNPTGTYIDKERFLRLINHVPPNILIVIDEAYAEYILIDDYPTTLEYLSTYNNIIITRTFSKIYGLAGLRLGYGISSPDIADILNRARLPFNVNSIAAKAACGALEDNDHVLASVKINQAGQHQIQQALQQLGLSYITGIGNFITIDVGNGQDVYHALLKKGIIVRPLLAYNMPRHIRVTISIQTENQRFIDALQETISPIEQNREGNGL